MSDVLARWNDLPSKEAAEEILPCCGSKAWAEKMAAQRPIADEIALLAACDTACESLAESDWSEAFRSHPRIGERSASAPTSRRSAAWSGEEQRKVEIESDDRKMKMAEGNRRYEIRFGRTFIICATGKSAPEILEQMGRRLRNDDSTELYEAAEQQRQIARLRLKKWLAS
jgi:2-oxo-4-hydroxy-4-carboxy-5-ureidoimidazoline decarboxylase